MGYFQNRGMLFAALGLVGHWRSIFLFLLFLWSQNLPAKEICIVSVESIVHSKPNVNGNNIREYIRRMKLAGLSVVRSQLKSMANDPRWIQIAKDVGGGEPFSPTILGNFVGNRMDVGWAALVESVQVEGWSTPKTVKLNQRINLENLPKYIQSMRAAGISIPSPSQLSALSEDPRWVKIAEEIGKLKSFNPFSLYSFANRFYPGGWWKLLEDAAGENKEISSKPFRWSREGIIRVVKKLNAAGIKLNTTTLEKNQKFFDQILQEEFGSTNSAQNFHTAIQRRLGYGDWDEALKSLSKSLGVKPKDLFDDPENFNWKGGLEFLRIADTLQRKKLLDKIVENQDRPQSLEWKEARKNLEETVQKLYEDDAPSYVAIRQSLNEHFDGSWAKVRDAYMSSLKFPPIDATNEELVLDWQKTFNRMDKEELIRRLTPWIIAMARDVGRSDNVTIEDLVTAGQAAADRKFDTYRRGDVGLLGYLRARVIGAMIDLKREGYINSRNKSEKAEALDQMRAKLRQKLGKLNVEAELQEILDENEMDMDRMDIEISMEIESSFESSRGGTLRERIETKDANQINQWESNELLNGLVEKLPPLRRQIIQLYYFEHISSKEIGLRVNLSAAGVNWNIREAQAQLKEMLEARGIFN